MKVNPDSISSALRLLRPPSAAQPCGPCSEGPANGANAEPAAAATVPSLLLASAASPALAREIPLADALPDPASSQLQAPLTIEGLKEAWGQAGSRYDLDGDGTVGFADLLRLLAQLARAADPNAPGETPDTPAAPVPAAPESPSVADASDPALAKSEAPTAPADPAAALANPAGGDLLAAGDAPGTDEPFTIEGLKEAWGEVGSRYDLNQDGTVNFADLLRLLDRMSRLAAARNGGDQGDSDADDQAAAATAVPSAVADTGPTTGPLGESADKGPLTLAGLLEAWGQGADSPYDTNLDGTVNFADLMNFLARMRPTESRETGGPLAGPDLPAPTQTLASAPDLTAGLRLDRIAEALVGRFQAGGFDSYPPANLHAVVDQLNLSGTDRQGLLDRLQRVYPDGLGLDVVG